MVAVDYRRLMQPGDDGELLTLADFIAAIDPEAWWKDKAACRGEPTETFFPGRGQQHLTRRARAICEGCPVRRECEQYALDFSEHDLLAGIWGGTTQQDRKLFREQGTATRP